MEILRKYIGTFLFGLITLFFCQSTFAACMWYSSPWSINVTTTNLGNTIVQRDTPIGSTLMTTFVSNGYDSNTRFAYCMAGETGSWNISGVSPVSGFAHTYQTNVAGVGLRIQAATSSFYYGASGSPDTYYVETTTAPWPGRGWAWSNWGTGYTISLIKTGPTGNGDIGATQSTFTLTGLGALLRLNITGGTITTVACSITTPNVNVPLDPVLASSFTAVNSTRGDTPFTIGLECDAGARINASLSFTQNTGTSNNSVIQLTGAGTPGVATGVGIQLLYGSTILKNNTNVVLKTSTGGQEFPAGAFTARYFQTAGTVTTGDANATATLNLTYQ
ncbi:MAG: fimbrial protein [Serratia sp. (in: enterobacteria)]|uniref:fimbrial protein n=1 Tax=Serratia sp. (in: enterobacteria) TaxID=616 RepID=UPI003F35BC69